ncbi:MAG: SEC-C domain-containing protein [Candidatus Thiodiazotropha sp. (ex. Lucinisca nassula)]|nr:SEC-C domain-containing protein [Candidatus Thiodiazotropha sp. (ex. Lucinisca nassula)]
MKDHNNNTLTLEYDLSVTECPCGSGKKPERCCGPIKPRTHSVDIDYRNYIESDGLAIGLDYKLLRVVDGELRSLIGTPKFTQSYKRDNNKNKVLTKGVTTSNHPMRPDSVLWNYDHIFSVDTNTITIENISISMTGVIHAYIDNTKSEPALRYSPVMLLEFWDTDVKPELLGWLVTINSILENKHFEKKKIALIVDSELDKLDKINLRQIPILDDIYLPSNFTFVFATADSASNIACKLIRLSDTLSTSKLKAIKKNLQSDSLYETPYPCRLFRQWISEK